MMIQIKMTTLERNQMNPTNAAFSPSYCTFWMCVFLSDSLTLCPPFLPWAPPSTSSPSRPVALLCSLSRNGSHCLRINENSSLLSSHKLSLQFLTPLLFNLLLFPVYLLFYLIFFYHLSSPHFPLPPSLLPVISITLLLTAIVLLLPLPSLIQHHQYPSFLHVCGTMVVYCERAPVCVSVLVSFSTGK